jgi:hypothetical protein
MTDRQPPGPQEQEQEQEQERELGVEAGPPLPLEQVRATSAAGCWKRPLLCASPLAFAGVASIGATCSQPCGLDSQVWGTSVISSAIRCISEAAMPVRVTASARTQVARAMTPLLCWTPLAWLKDACNSF